MTTSTHWTALKDPENWDDNPAEAPGKAVRDYLKADRGNEDIWKSWYSLEKYGETTVELRGFIETNELIEDENAQFEGYEPGCSWFKFTGETKEFRVSLKIEEV